MTTHERLTAKWNACEFGVKQKVLDDEIPQATIQYVLANPTYGNEQKMESIIGIIDKHVKEFYSKATSMTNYIEAI